MKCLEKQMTHSTKTSIVHLWQLLYGRIISLEKTRRVSYSLPQEKSQFAHTRYSTMTYSYSIIPKLFNSQMGPLVESAGWSQSFPAWRGKPSGQLCYVGRRETASNPSQHTGSLPKGSSGIQAPRPWNAAPWREDAWWERGLIPGAPTAAPYPALSYFMTDTEAQREWQVPILRLDCNTPGLDAIRKGDEKWCAFSTVI